MGIRHTRKRKNEGKPFTRHEIATLVEIFLDKYEADMAADYRPEEKIWRTLLARRLGDFIYSRGRR